MKKWMYFFIILFISQSVCFGAQENTKSLCCYLKKKCIAVDVWFAYKVTEKTPQEIMMQAAKMEDPDRMKIAIDFFGVDSCEEKDLTGKSPKDIALSLENQKILEVINRAFLKRMVSKLTDQKKLKLE